VKLGPIVVTILLAATQLFGIDTDTRAADRVFAFIRNNDLRDLQAAVEQGAGVNSRGDRETTPLMYAAAFGSLESVKLLLAAQVNAHNAVGATALMWSVTEPAKVRLLVEHGADVNAKSTTGRTALLLAALHNGSDEVVDLLIAKGADVHARDNRGLTFLLAASAACNSRQVRLAVDAGLDVNAKDESLGFTPLMNAAGNGDLDSVKLLLAKGAHASDVSAKDPVNVLRGPIDLGYYTPLMLGSLYGPPAIVDALLRAGAKVEARDIRGRTALHYAVSTEAQNPEIVQLLLKAHSDPAVKDNIGETAVDWAAKYQHPGTMRALGVPPAAPSKAAKMSAASTPLPPIRVAVGRSLELLQGVSSAFMKNGGCVACHAQDLTALTAKYAKAHGFAVDDVGLKSQLGDLRASYIRNGDRFLQRYDGGGAIDTLDYAMLHLAAVDYPADGMTDSIVYNMVSEQMADGSWIRGGAVQRGGPSPAARAPMQDSDIVRTAQALRAIRTYGWEGRKADLDSHVEAARLWLLRAKPVYNEEFVMQLLGLYWAGEKAATIGSLGHKLIEQQLADGGWSQNPYLPADSYATGQTLFALSEAGILKPADPGYRRGVEYLLRTQHEDGSWHVKSRSPKLQPYFQSGFPYDQDQWISMAATAWATIALTLASPAEM
jgi:ankyrin repeat protein